LATLVPINAITIEPRHVIMNATAQKRLLEKHKVEVIPVEYKHLQMRWRHARRHYAAHS
jgi:hypothetical protein